MDLGVLFLGREDGKLLDGLLELRGLVQQPGFAEARRNVAVFLEEVHDFGGVIAKLLAETADEARLLSTELEELLLIEVPAAGAAGDELVGISLNGVNAAHVEQ